MATTLIFPVSVPALAGSWGGYLLEPIGHPNELIINPAVSPLSDGDTQQALIYPTIQGIASGGTVDKGWQEEVSTYLDGIWKVLNAFIQGHG